MNELMEQISRFIEDTRDADGAQNFVWLPDRGVMVHLETCTDMVLMSAAMRQLAAERSEVAAMLFKVRCRVKELEDAAKT